MLEYLPATLEQLSLQTAMHRSLVPRLAHLTSLHLLSLFDITIPLLIQIAELPRLAQLTVSLSHAHWLLLIQIAELPWLAQHMVGVSCMWHVCHACGMCVMHVACVHACGRCVMHVAEGPCRH